MLTDGLTVRRVALAFMSVIAWRVGMWAAWMAKTDAINSPPGRPLCRALMRNISVLSVKSAAAIMCLAWPPRTGLNSNRRVSIRVKLPLATKFSKMPKYSSTVDELNRWASCSSFDVRVF